ncbi:MAG: lamin tail domain-containing protein [Deltaproteobacteria bacterium]|nr:lamin tail domain-containing protein [Deltaproteobacteria bacterium]
MRPALAMLVAVTACSGGSAPEINGLVDQIAIVGQELVVSIDGTDADGDQLVYGVKSDVSLQGTAMITQTPNGHGVFRWTPLAVDVGLHTFDFSASDAANTTTVSISIDVRSAVGAVPIFRQPLGTGTVVNLAQTSCATFDVVVEDADTADVAIAMEAPVIPGATLDAVDGTHARFRWCPTPAQIAAADRYTLILSADDTDNPKTIKNFIIVLKSSTPRLVINEVDYDNIGTDTAEFIELLNASASPVSLAGLQIVLVNGANGLPYDTIDLSPVGSLAGNQYLVIAGPGVTAQGSAAKLDPVWSQDQIQNGSPDGIALIDGVTHTLIDALSYEGAVTATIPGFPAPVSLVEGTVLPTTTADNNTATRSLCRIPDGTDTNNAATDWAICTTLTPGRANVP